MRQVAPSQAVTSTKRTFMAAYSFTCYVMCSVHAFYLVTASRPH